MAGVCLWCVHVVMIRSDGTAHLLVQVTMRFAGKEMTRDEAILTSEGTLMCMSAAALFAKPAWAQVSCPQPHAFNNLETLPTLPQMSSGMPRHEQN